MILQQRLAPLAAINYQKPTGKVTPSLTIPGRAIDMKYAMEQYKRGTLIERTAAIYEKEGMVMPDFAMMTRIERLQKLAEFRAMSATAVEKINNLHNQAKTKHNEVLAEKQKQKESGSKRTDNTDKPDAK